MKYPRTEWRLLTPPENEEELSKKIATMSRWLCYDDVREVAVMLANSLGEKIIIEECFVKEVHTEQRAEILPQR